MQPSIFHYSDARAYLVDAFRSKQERNPRFSVRAWSRQMGFKCHSSLVLLAQGRRKIRPEHVDKLAQGLRIPAAEEKYLRALVHFQNARTATEKDYYESQLKLFHPARDFSILETERFRLVADWLHMALLEMTRLKDFRASAEWIRERLAFDVDRKQIEDALNRLINLNLLRREGGTLAKTQERLTTPKDFAAECIREHHKQVMANAIRAIDEQDVSERMFNSCAMTIDASKLDQAKALVRKFREDMTKLMEKDSGDETYQLTVGFFRLTGEKAKAGNG